MIPPTINGCTPENGSTLHENVIHLDGNGFQYEAHLNPPKVFRLPWKKKALITWSYTYKTHFPPDEMQGGAAPSEMTIWIKKLKPGATYRLEFIDFIAEFTAGPEICYQKPVGNIKYPVWFNTVFKRKNQNHR